MLKKALTFSYDDGVEQDRKLLALFNRYGMKCTFNLNSGIQKHAPWFYKDVVPVYRMNPDGLRALYQGHEIAIHGLKHIHLAKSNRAEQEIELLEDKKNLEKMFGYPIEGMAYAFGEYDDTSVDILKTAGVKYARGTDTTHSFAPETDLLRLKGTCHHNDEKLFELGEEFLKLNPETPQIFYIWGHSYEFDFENGWERFEKFLKMMSGKADILYGTNMEVFQYFNIV